ncbi:hypothetical protein PM03_08990 [Thalassobacter stenotrophicus]|uniref:double-strand break repair helicase AddA n=1 Tax=Thalassobacter TaxID=266808 RepID=UPI00051CCD05|nr:MULTISPECIES: double-strand break repair helicase AddA [Thalassobacter]KGK79615.1 hypothetical protein PM03_08990 [Thalassobacter stenotrophicus]KGL01444.1 helicase UvrD [Thalassobacter sp. 16PALIMAR09]
MTHPASAAQIAAANPGTSTWLSANAGSGKTRVLTNRVAWLLLEGTPPERILCLTYTKAAAGEMQNRLFAQLGAWAMMEDAELRAELSEMGVPDSSEVPLDHARTLFARAIETPGGLKIQTIHAFCASLLRRFPLEAGVSPQFSEMDDRAGTLLAAETLEELVATPEGTALFDDVAQHLTDQDAEKFCAQIIKSRDHFARARSRADIFAAFDLDEADDVMAQALTPEVLHDFNTMRGALQGVDSKTMVALAERLAPLDLNHASQEVFEAFLNTFLTGKFELRKNPVTAPVLKKLDPDMIEDLKEVARAAHERRGRQAAAAQTAALHAFAAPYLARIEDRKAARGWLDFDDLIQKTRALLSRSDVAQWVLFKLDGGIDHILVDEAQDTSPVQWDVITALAAEFASGEGARSDVARTLFVVGDKKQSIYSFQGAAPEKFDEMRETFAERLAAVDAPFQSRELQYSFRSAPTILNLVDATCGDGRAPGTGSKVLHTAFFEDKPGRVDLWPVIPSLGEADPDRAWFDPVDRPARNDPKVLMAERVATQIEQMLSDRTLITVGKERRPVQPGDIVILLQRRKELFNLILEKCKARNLPLAGADVLRISGEMAVKDLTALLSFLATPEDDLSLAAVLRSPLFGWSEDDLFRLAHPRGKAFLWEALRRRGTPENTVTELQELLRVADFLRPYELLERVLARMGGRRRFRARLGDECIEALDALLQQALTYEQNDVPSLTGFLTWLDAEEIKIKRQMDARAGLIRIMSVHGAKGLESPVVILPECQFIKAQGAPRFVEGPDDLLTWKPGASLTPPELAEQVEAKAMAQQDEKDRLLYVAMTRAESWLIVGAAGELGKDPTASWYGKIEEGLRDLGAEPLTMDGEQGLQLISGDWSAATETAPTVAAPMPPLNAIYRAEAPGPVATAQTRSPSDLGGAKALSGEGLTEDIAKLRGTLIHLLLEHLPDVPPSDWDAAARHLLAGSNNSHPDLNPDHLIQEAVGTLNTLPQVFAPGTLSEVAISAPPLPGDDRVLYGVIDRLLVTPSEIICADIKTNAVVPDTPQAVPLGLLRQMGAYAQALAPLYPDRKITPAIVWTRTASLMVLPHDLVTAALQTTVDG